MLKESETDTGQTHKLTNHKESVTLSATLSTFDRPVSACPHQPHLPPASGRPGRDAHYLFPSGSRSIVLPDPQPARRAFSAVTHFIRSICCVEVSYAPLAVSCSMQEESQVIHQPCPQLGEFRHSGGFVCAGTPRQVPWPLNVRSPLTCDDVVTPDSRHVKGPNPRWPLRAVCVAQLL
eukprot:scaffold48381_cov62-Phaeocystis_antarctica.AAC.2